PATSRRAPAAAVLGVLAAPSCGLRLRGYTSALAVGRLRTRSNLVGCSTGRSLASPRVESCMPRRPLRPPSCAHVRYNKLGERTSSCTQALVSYQLRCKIAIVCKQRDEGDQETLSDPSGRGV